jgi:hypothetical protein
MTPQLELIGCPVQKLETMPLFSPHEFNLKKGLKKDNFCLLVNEHRKSERQFFGDE